MADYTHILSPELKSAGIDLGVIGVAGTAWRRADAFCVLKVLAEARFAVLGGDVLELQGKGPSHTYDNWFVPCRSTAQSWGIYCQTSIAQTREYIASYEESGRDIVYLIVATDDPDAAAPF